MTSEIEALAARIRHLEDIEAIKRLKALYCQYCDGGWPRQGGSHRGPVADLFTEDGIWDARPGMPLAEGRAAIRTLFEDFRAIPFAVHPVTNPLIEIDGDRATGQWHLIGGGEMPAGAAYLFMGIYDEEYHRTPDGWRIKSMRITEARHAPVAWARSDELGSWGPGIEYQK